MERNGNIGRVVKQLRLRADMTRLQLSARSGISASHLTRIENGQRRPSARVLHRIAPHLGVGEVELLSLAGYVSPEGPGAEDIPYGQLDPYVVACLTQEPAEVQRAVITVFSAMKYIAEGMAAERARCRDDGNRPRGRGPRA